MNIQYRNDNHKIISKEEITDKFSGYKEHILNDVLKIRERYIAGYIFAIHYYKEPDEDNDQIVVELRSTPDLKMLSIRERQAYGDFWVDDIRYFDFEENQFSPFIIRELYNFREQCIAWESTDTSLPRDDERYLDLSKLYYATENGIEDEYFVSHYHCGTFSDIEYFSEGVETDYQDVERGFEGNYADRLMMKMNIPTKMRAWYMNDIFLPEL